MRNPCRACRGEGMKVLIACEESQTVCKAFRAKGHEAYSCDIIEPSGGHPEWHILGDAVPLLNGNCKFTTMDGQTHEQRGEWDMLIAFPPCTNLAVSGARWFAEKQRDFRQQKSIAFFMRFVLAHCSRIAVENPIGIMSSVYEKPTQIIQPWQFGDNYAKSTCLWLKGLDPLVPKIMEKPEMEFVEWIDKRTGRKKRQAKWYMDAFNLPPEERAKLRSKTFPGIAKAMAEQWG